MSNKGGKGNKSLREVSPLEYIFKIYSSLEELPAEYLGMLRFLCDKGYYEKTGRWLNRDYPTIVSKLIEDISNYNPNILGDLIYTLFKNFDGANIASSGLEDKIPKEPILDKKEFYLDEETKSKILTNTTLPTRSLVCGLSPNGMDWKDYIRIQVDELGISRNSIGSGLKKPIKRGYIILQKTSEKRINKIITTEKGKELLKRREVDEDFLKLVEKYDSSAVNEYYKLIRSEDLLEVSDQRNSASERVEIDTNNGRYLTLRRGGEQKKLIIEGSLTNAGKRFRDVLNTIKNKGRADGVGDLIDYNLIEKKGDSFFLTGYGEYVYNKLLLTSKKKF